jgi:hypothetical protein
MVKNESLTTTPEFNTNESEGAFAEINRELMHDVLDPSKIHIESFDSRTGDDLRNNPEQAECRSRLLAVSEDIHNLLGIPYNASESPISGQNLPELPNLRSRDAKGEHYAPYLERIRALKGDVEVLVQRLRQDGVNVGFFDPHTGERIPDNSVNKLAGSAKENPIAFMTAISGLRQETLSRKLGEIRNQAKEEFNSAYENLDRGAQGRTSVAPPRTSETPEFTEPEKPENPPVVEQPIPVKPEGIKPEQVEPSAEADAQTPNPDNKKTNASFEEYMNKMQEEALDRFAKGMGMEVTDDLRRIYKEGGAEAVTKEFYRKAKEEKVGDESKVRRDIEILGVRKEIMKETIGQLTEAYDKRDEAIINNLEESQEAINIVFATGPGGEKGNLGQEAAVRILSGKFFSNKLMNERPDLAATRDEAYEIVFDDELVTKSVELTKGSVGGEPTQADIAKRRFEMVSVAEEPKEFMENYRQIKAEKGR